MKENALIDLIIQERLSLYFKHYLKHGQEEVKKSDEFLLLIKEKAPDLEEDFQQYLDWMAEHGGNEQEGLYLFGIADGVRLMKDIFNMV